MRLTPEEIKACLKEFHTRSQSFAPLCFEPAIQTQSILAYQEGVVLFWKESSRGGCKDVYGMSYDEGKWLLGYFSSADQFIRYF